MLCLVSWVLEVQIKIKYIKIKKLSKKKKGSQKIQWNEMKKKVERIKQKQSTEYKAKQSKAMYIMSKANGKSKEIKWIVVVEWIESAFFYYFYIFNMIFSQMKKSLQSKG